MAATYVRNRCPTAGIPDEKTPLEVFYGKIPDVQHLRPWGCKVSVFIPEHRRTKLGPKSYPAVMVGYGTDQKGYRVFNPTTSSTKVVKHVRFFEDAFLTATGDLGAAKFSWPEPHPTPPSEAEAPQEEDIVEEEAPRRPIPPPVDNHHPLSLPPIPLQNQFSPLLLLPPQENHDDGAPEGNEETLNGSTAQRDVPLPVSPHDNTPDSPTIPQTTDELVQQPWRSCH